MTSDVKLIAVTPVLAHFRVDDDMEIVVADHVAWQREQGYAALGRRVVEEREVLRSAKARARSGEAKVLWEIVNTADRLAARPPAEGEAEE